MTSRGRPGAQGWGGPGRAPGRSREAVSVGQLTLFDPRSIDHESWIYESMIERVPAGKMNRALDEWKSLQDDGWDVTALKAPDSRSVVFLACRDVSPRADAGTTAHAEDRKPVRALRN